MLWPILYFDRGGIIAVCGPCLQQVQVEGLRSGWDQDVVESGCPGGAKEGYVRVLASKNHPEEYKLDQSEGFRRICGKLYVTTVGRGIDRFIVSP